MFRRASSLYGAFGSKTLSLILRHRTNAFVGVFGKRQQMRTNYEFGWPSEEE